MKNILEYFDLNWILIEANPLDGNCAWMQKSIDTMVFYMFQPQSRLLVTCMQSTLWLEYRV